MRRNVVKAALKSGSSQIGSWINIGDTFSTRLMARAGFPWLTVDMEHSPIDWAQASVLFGFIADAGVVPLCRVPDGSHENIKRALDAGAWGIVAPMVDTVSQAKDIISACKYPPEGNRSIGGGSHFLSFGTSDAEYKEKANGEILVVLQIESPLGVENAEAIASLPGVDALFVGPNDLKWQTRKTLPGGRFPTPDEYSAQLERVLAACKKGGIASGIHTFGIEDARDHVARGFQLVAVQSDAGFLGAEATRYVSELAIVKESSTSSNSAAASGGLGKY